MSYLNQLRVFAYTECLYLLNVVLSHCVLSNFDCFLLHVIAHVDRLDLSLELFVCLFLSHDVDDAVSNLSVAE